MKRYARWVVFVGCLLVLGLGATPIGKVADLTLISVRLSVIAVLSVLAFRETWKYFHDERPSNGTLLERCRHWYHGEA